MGMGEGRAKAVACGQQASCATTRAASHKSAQPRAQRAQARVPRALRPALLARTARDVARPASDVAPQRAMARAHSERASAPSERSRARALRAIARVRWGAVRRLAIGQQQLCDERMGCAHMASNGCVRTAHGRAMRRVFALRLIRFEILI